MLLFVLFFDTRDEVCRCNRCNKLFILCDLWPSTVTFSVCQGHFHLIIRCALCCCILVPSIKFVGSIDRSMDNCNLNDVKVTSSPIQISWNSNTNLPRGYLSFTPNFIFIGHKRAEIHSREVNRKSWRKKICHCDLDLWP